MTQITAPRATTVGVLALQGAFSEHIQLLRHASSHLSVTTPKSPQWTFLEVRTPTELSACDALIIPGGESTTISLVASRSSLLEPLRAFVKSLRKPTWGTCAGLILLAESANRTKKGGQELIGGLDVRVDRNHFGRQTESFEADLELAFLGGENGQEMAPFRGVFIRAPVVEKVLPHQRGVQVEEAGREETVVAPSLAPKDEMAGREISGEVEVLARLPGHARTIGRGRLKGEERTAEEEGEAGDIIAVRQGNVFGTSFHPELTGDDRIHVWWLRQVLEAVERRRDA